MLTPAHIILIKEAVSLSTTLAVLIQKALDGGMSEEEAEKMTPTVKARKADMMERMRDL